MVRLHVKKGDESQFLFDTTSNAALEDVLTNIVIIYNGRLKISRLCMEMEELANHGTMLPHDMMGLTDEQVEDLKLVDEWGEKCIPSGGWTFNKDGVGRRNGRQPSDKMQEVLRKTVEEAKAMVSKKQVEADVPVTLKMIQEALDMLRGSVTIVYPMGLPPQDIIRQEFENIEDLSGTQASLEVMELSMASLWFSGKEMQRSKKLSEYLGRNEKTRAVVKLQKIGQGAPSREPIMSETDQKTWMMHAYRKQEEMKVGDQHSCAAHNSLQHINSTVPQQSNADFCKVDTNPTLPAFAPEDENDASDNDSSDFISRMLEPKTSEPVPSIRPIMTDLTSIINGTDFSFFNLNRL